jgi:hypothetical protein
MAAGNVMFQMFEMFQTVFHLNVANKSRMLHMLQAYVLSVSGVSNVYFKCFIWMLHM